MAFYRVPTEFLLAILCALTTLSLHFHGTHNAGTALSRCSHCADCVLKTFVCTMDLKHSTPLSPPPSLSSKNDVNSVCSILELLDLHIGKQESSLLAYVRHSERNAYLHI